MLHHFDTTIDSHRAHREPRCYVALEASLVLNFEAWQLLWKLETVNISQSGVLCRYHISNEAEEMAAQELITLLDAQPDCHLQIDVVNHEFFSPSLLVTLKRKAKHIGALELAFGFETNNNDIELMLDSLTNNLHITPQKAANPLISDKSPSN